ncbi:hypothetical protein NPIL_376561 [Nephila pilipes]|uniref:Reverse transcriptase domain-containing protein n=1 Tax=Nephila pilipes TaxID=299642 RepID=A0A8X6PXK2_NEPPI|nr:hypothetical protein NPIL_376561 [Nephila pilipes]
MAVGQVYRGGPGNPGRDSTSLDRTRMDEEDGTSREERNPGVERHGRTSIIRTSAGWTGPIAMKAGVRQGCPLSAILFKISLEQVLRTGVSAPGYCLYGQELNALPMPITCCC